jgi:ABC-2 type transport system permease protein
VAIVESVSALQRALQGKDGNWIGEIRSLRESGIQTQMLPTWILVLVLMVGFIVMPAQVAEEKEKKHLLGLLQTPIREVEWLLAKVCFGTIAIVVAALLLHLLTRFDFDLGGGLGYLVFLLAGGFCFSAFGIFVGFLCRTQAAARTLGVLFYLPHLLPSALADFSRTLNSVAPLLPSYQFYRPIKSILLEGGGASDFPLQLAFLFGFGLLSLFVSHRLMKRRWLM